MRTGVSRRTPRGEEGATLVILVLVLVALFGVIVLVVDVGGLLWARRGMVNASDAAALAAAQSCIGLDEDEVAKADEFAQFNVEAGTVLTRTAFETENCHANKAGLVRVSYEREYPLFFAGVLGFSGDGGQVTTEATAHWGPAGAAGPIPLTIYVGSLQGNCEIPFVEPGATCYIWEDNDISGNGNFGFLDVGEGWNVPRSRQCRNQGGVPELEGWIDGSTPVDDVGLNYPSATWVCTIEMEGGNNPAWRAVEDIIGETRDFPIVGPTPADGEPQQIPNPHAKYNVIGFAQFEIVDVNKASKLESGDVSCSVPRTSASPIDLLDCVGAPSNATFVGLSASNPFTGNWGSSNPQVSPEGVLTWTGSLPNGNRSVKFSYETDDSDCGGNPAPNASAHCLVLKWNGATIGGTRPGGGANFGLDAVALCDRKYDSCLDPPS